jgi:hypothetical protein
MCGKRMADITSNRKDDMNSHCETTQPGITARDVFRHTPYEHETTTDTDSLETVIEPATVTMIRPLTDERALIVQSLATTNSGR